MFRPNPSPAVAFHGSPHTCAPPPPPAHPPTHRLPAVPAGYAGRQNTAGSLMENLYLEEFTRQIEVGRVRFEGPAARDANAPQHVARLPCPTCPPLSLVPCLSPPPPPQSARAHARARPRAHAHVHAPTRPHTPFPPPSDKGEPARRGAVHQACRARHEAQPAGHRKRVRGGAPRAPRRHPRHLFSCRWLGGWGGWVGGRVGGWQHEWVGGWVGGWVHGRCCMRTATCSCLGCASARAPGCIPRLCLRAAHAPSVPPAAAPPLQACWQTAPPPVTPCTSPQVGACRHLQRPWHPGAQLWQRGWWAWRLGCCFAEPLCEPGFARRPQGSTSHAGRSLFTAYHKCRLAFATSRHPAAGYGASKAGVITLVKLGACELAPYQIRVAGVAPGEWAGPVEHSAGQGGDGCVGAGRQQGGRSGARPVVARALLAPRGAPACADRHAPPAPVLPRARNHSTPARPCHNLQATWPPPWWVQC